MELLISIINHNLIHNINIWRFDKIFTYWIFTSQIYIYIYKYSETYLLVITYIWFQLHDITYKLQYNYQIL